MRRQRPLRLGVSVFWVIAISVVSTSKTSCQEPLSLPSPTNTAVTCFAFSPNSDSLVSGARNGAITFVDLARREVSRTIELEGSIRDLRWGKSGDCFGAIESNGSAESSRNRFQLWLGEEFEKINTAVLDMQGLEIVDFDFSPDGKYLILAYRPQSTTSGYTGGIRVVDLETLQIDTSLEVDGLIRQARFSPEGSYLLVLGSPYDGPTEGAIWGWKVDGLVPLPTKRSTLSLSRLTVAPNGELVAAIGIDASVSRASERRVAVMAWPIEGETASESISGLMGGIPEMAFAPDSEWLAASVVLPRQSNARDYESVQLYNLKHESARMLEANSRCLSLGFSSDGRWLATVFNRPTVGVRVWNARTGELTRILRISQELSVDEFSLCRFSPDAKRLVVHCISGSQAEEPVPQLLMWENMHELTPEVIFDETPQDNDDSDKQ